MAAVGIRELRDHVSSVIRRVHAGEIIDVTNRGRPVARLVPVTGRTVLDRLIAEGKAIPGTGDVLAHPPLPRRKGDPVLSEVLAELRRDER